MRKIIVVVLVGTGLWTGSWWLSPPFSGHVAEAQTGKTSKSKGSAAKKQSVRVLDLRAARLQDEFVREAKLVARDYIAAGELKKSKELLESIRKVDPSVTGLDQQIKKLQEALLEANEMEFDVDVGKGWDVPRARVSKGKTFRIQATGKYRFVSSASVGPEGFATENPSTDMAGGVPCGALMGLIVTKGKKKLGQPFPVEAGREYTPKNDGALFLRVNVPPASKCTGRIRVRLSGAVEAN